MRLRFIASIVLICIMLLLLVGCGTDYKGVYYSEKNEELYMELKDDNVLIIGLGSSEIEGIYEIKGNEISIGVMGLASGGWIEGKTIIDPDGVKWIKK